MKNMKLKRHPKNVNKLQCKRSRLINVPSLASQYSGPRASRITPRRRDWRVREHTQLTAGDTTDIARTMFKCEQYTDGGRN